MSIFIVAISILQNFAISLGVGSSTLAIVNFFVAIADGEIDETERRMMGVVYVVLRVAMVLILLTTVGLATLAYSEGGLAALTTLLVAQLFVLVILYGNAILMTLHRMPTTFGPGLQAGSWYTLGTLASLHMLDLATFTFTEFLLGYATGLVLAIGVVNGVMAILKARRQS